MADREAIVQPASFSPPQRARWHCFAPMPPSPHPSPKFLSLTLNTHLGSGLVSLELTQVSLLNEVCEDVRVKPCQLGAPSFAPRGPADSPLEATALEEMVRAAHGATRACAERTCSVSKGIDEGHAELEPDDA